jgi:hypothetical protein
MGKPFEPPPRRTPCCLLHCLVLHWLRVFVVNQGVMPPMVIGKAIKVNNAAQTPGDGSHTLSEPHIRIASQMELTKQSMSELTAINRDMARTDAALSALKQQRLLAAKAAEDAESRALAIQRSLRELDLNTHQSEWIDDVRRFALAKAAEDTSMSHVDVVEPPPVTDDKKGLTKRERVLADFIRAEGFLESAKERRVAAGREGRTSTVDIADVTIDSDAIHEGVVQRFKAGNMIRIARKALRQGLARDGVDVAGIAELQSPAKRATRSSQRRASTGPELPPLQGRSSRKSSVDLPLPSIVAGTVTASGNVGHAPHRPSASSAALDGSLTTHAAGLQSWRDLNLEEFADFDEVKAHQFRIIAFKKKIQDLKKHR